MITCCSCKNKTSTDRCTNKVLRGLLFCGTHARVKNPKVWIDVNRLSDKVILIQKLWRGYCVRNWLNLSGPGVLKRSICHNEEELVTFEDKASVHPLDYFAFEEAGKVYWFDIRSLVQNSMTKLQPENPYTRKQLSFDTRQRMRRLSVRRIYNGLRNLHTDLPPMSADDMINIVWLNVCQIIEENGFFDLTPNYFTALNRSQLYIFNQLIHRDLIAWAAEHTGNQSRRKRYIGWLYRLRGQYLAGTSHSLLSYMTAKCLLSILNDSREQYSVCFIIMSALHRV